MPLNSSQYTDLMDRYAQTQIENQLTLKDRKAEVYEKLPRIREIDQEIAASSIHAIRERLDHGNDTTGSAKEKNHKLIAEKKALLQANGYSEDYLQPIYTCPLCHDTGRVGTRYCSCFEQAAISLLYRQSNLEQVLQTENVEHFDLSYYPKDTDDSHPYSPYENMSNTLSRVKEFVSSFDNAGGNLLFYGETGLGKTFLSHCIAKALLDTHHTVLYQSSIHLFEDICSDAVMNKGRNPQNEETYRYLYSCDLLIIDDLGTEYTNSFVSSELYNILNTRMRDKKSTLISTNLNLQELTERYSDRITTRIIAEYKVFNFYGSNIRLAKRKKAIQK